MESEEQDQRPINPRVFHTTHWSVVVRAGENASPDAQAALATLCETYWFPLYSYVRRKGHSPDDAADITQDFFASLLTNETIRRADQTRGRFRTFLLTSLQNFLSNWHRARKAQKRGGDRKQLSLNFQDGERQFQLEPATTLTPERAFERRWAMVLMAKAMEKLEQEQTEAGRESTFSILKHYLGGTESQRPYKEICDQLGLTEGAVKVAVHRLRKRCREILRSEIEQTVDSSDQVDDELLQLFSAISSQ